jgi:hypothetical protein
MNKVQIKNKAEGIEKIYREYKDKIKKLEKERDKILEEFIYELERKKLEEIRNKFKQ